MSHKTAVQIWPNVDDAGAAKNAARQGWSAAFLCAAVTVAGVFINWNESKIDWLPADPWALVDAFLFTIIGWGVIQKTSRVAAVAGLLLYFFERLYAWSIHGVKSPVVAIILTLMFVNAVRGTFAYHKYVKREN